jgi:DNA-binding IscR family transcriptional regulator
MRLSSMADYAVVTMTAAARHCGGARISAQQLAEETGLPAPPCRSWSAASAAGLLKSRGAAAGWLARPAAAITLADIIEAVEGPIALAPCSTPVRQDCTCSLEKDCTVRPHWPVVDALRGALSAVPLPSLPARSRRSYHDEPRTGTQDVEGIRPRATAKVEPTNGFTSDIEQEYGPRACPKTPSASSRPRRTSRNGCWNGA